MDIDIETQKLYFNNSGKKSFQWELWPLCNSGCKFCLLNGENKVDHYNRRLKSLNDLEIAIDNLDFNTYNNISLIGGEFFQGQLNTNEIRTKFFNIIKKIYQLYINKKIGSIWIMCTLTIGDQKDLYELLDLAESMKVFPQLNFGASGLWLCTSWDSTGRFHNQQMKDNWEYHMKNIKNKYPWIKFNTTIILQQSFIDLYNNNQFKPKEFMKEFNTTIFYKQCGTYKASDKSNLNMEECLNAHLHDKIKINKELGFTFFPTRNSFLKFLNKYYHDDRDTFDKLFNIKYRADEFHRNFNDNTNDMKLIRSKIQIGVEAFGNDGFILPCGHVNYYAPYIDTNKCCMCDRETIIN